MSYFLLRYNQSNDKIRDSTKNIRNYKVMLKYIVQTRSCTVYYFLEISKQQVLHFRGEIDDPVSFSHLLSHGYQVDWGKNMAETRKQKMESKRVRFLISDIRTLYVITEHLISTSACYSSRYN